MAFIPTFQHSKIATFNHSIIHSFLYINTTCYCSTVLLNDDGRASFVFALSNCGFRFPVIIQLTSYWHVLYVSNFHRNSTRPALRSATPLPICVSSAINLSTIDKLLQFLHIHTLLSRKHYPPSNYLALWFCGFECIYQDATILRKQLDIPTSTI